jgi:K319L-like, PKD domain
MANTWYIRADGGNSTRCTGLANAADPGSGTAQACAYANLQDALTNCARGDTINVKAGDNFNTTSGFTLPTKSGSFSGSNYTVIQSSAVGSLPSKRVALSDVSNMPTITLTANAPVYAFYAATGVTGYKFDGLHITNNLTGLSGTTNDFVLIDYGASNFFFDRCIIHPGEVPTGSIGWRVRAKNAFNFGGSYQTVQRSYIYNLFGRDPNAALYAGVSNQYPISGMSFGSPTTITSASPHGMTSGDTVQVVSYEISNFQANHNLVDDYTVTVTGASTFTIPINTTGLSPTYSGSGAWFYKWPRISAITNANPAVVTVTGHGLVNGNIVRPQRLTGSLGSALNTNDYVCTFIDANTFSLPVNTTSLSAYSGTDGYYKSQGTGQQTECVYIQPSADHIDILNNYLAAWYAPMQTAGADGVGLAPNMSTVKASPTPTISGFSLNSTTGLAVGMPIAVNLVNDLDTSGVNGGSAHCPNHNPGDPCWSVGIVTGVDSGTGAITLNPYLMSKNENGLRVPAYVVPASGATAAWFGTMPSYINMNYNTIEIPAEFAEFHFATNTGTPKGFIEGKGTYQMNFEGNIMQGFPSTLAFTTTNQNCGSPWMQTSYVTIKNNWFKSWRSGILVSMTDYSCVCTQGHDLVVDNNLFTGLSPAWDSDFVRVSGAASNVQITHNSFVNAFPNVLSHLALTADFPSNGACPLCTGSTTYYAVTHPAGFIVRDNIMDGGRDVATGRLPDGTGDRYRNMMTTPVLTYNSFAITYPGSDPTFEFPDATTATFTNWAAVPFVGSNKAVITDWAVQSGSTAHNAAHDGTDRGVNIATLITALGNNSDFNPNAPIVNAGSDQSLSAGTTSTTLTATASDPNSLSLTYLWTNISGPNTPTIVSSTSLSTSVTGMIAGTYVFRFTATNTTPYSTSDDVQVFIATGGSPTPVPASVKLIATAI